jgi:hypothetical protein
LFRPRDARTASAQPEKNGNGSYLSVVLYLFGMMLGPSVAMSNFMATHFSAGKGDLATPSHRQSTSFDQVGKGGAVHSGAPHLNFMEVAWMLDQLTRKGMVKAFWRDQWRRFLGNAGENPHNRYH